MNRRNRFSRIPLAVLVAFLVAQAPLTAQAVPDPNSEARHSRIVGLWDVEVTITNCANGAPLFSFPAMHKFELGGTGQVVPATNPAALSAHLLAWNYVGDDQYQTVMKMYRFDATGNYVGWTEVTSEAAIDPETGYYEGAGIAEFFNLAGVVVATSCPVFEGTRRSSEF